MRLRRTHVTHTPFTPTPPYQPDWVRALTPTPYDDHVLQTRAHLTWTSVRHTRDTANELARRQRQRLSVGD